MTRQDLGSVLRFFAEIACSVKHEESAVASEDQGTGQRGEGSSREFEGMAPLAPVQE